MLDLLTPWFAVPLTFALVGPLDTIEGVLLRSAAGTVACGILWRYLARPVVQAFQRFFDDHHNAVIAVGAIQGDVRTLTGEVQKVSRWQDHHDVRFPDEKLGD